ncbi:hypothetical protein L6164_007705 [Bauhinia variegata]|uniref:Uncharacterized protein n=1 Tax=Bauhinia variegata TaxID=167791 RepID=A0ACB9PEK2_BAUVA|nr:hypothetical protein L6164_007705 [Bauhinia variegata]
MKSTPPTHLLDCLGTNFLSSVMDSNHKDEHQLNVRHLEGEQIKAANFLNAARTSLNKKEKYAYMKLLDLLINHPEDVRELRSSGILQNNLGSDEEVVELLNPIGSGLPHNPSQYSGIRDDVEKHYKKKKLSIWMAEAYYIYFRSPWTVVALLEALIALVLTALQTWLAFKSISK